MTEKSLKNNEIFLNLCSDVWDFDDNSLEYIKKRLSNDWKPVPELEVLINSKNSEYKDQRIRFDMNMKDKVIQSFFERDDKAYSLFLSYFGEVIRIARNVYSCDIGYSEFIENKVVFKKNLTKIKKVFETIYKENQDIFEYDSTINYTEEKCAKYITDSFEKIGSYKKSAKKLQFVISFNPVDWLLASTSENFSSCFNLDNKSGGYQYCLGLPFLCGDKNRMMLYITDGTQKNFMGITVDSVQARTWCILDEKNVFSVVKWYPNNSIGVNPIKSITGLENFVSSDCFSKGKYPLDILSTKKGAVINVYSDMGRWEEGDNGEIWHSGNKKSGQQLFSRSGVDYTNIDKRSIQFSSPLSGNLGFSTNGFRIKDWKRKGIHIDMFFPTPKCSCCRKELIGSIVESNGTEEFICCDCHKSKVFKCECGNTGIISENNIEVETVNGKKIKLCSACSKHIKERTCSECGKYSRHLLPATNNKNICECCIEKKGYFRCNNCGCYSKNIISYYNTFDNSVQSCCEDCIPSNIEDTVSRFGRYYSILKRKMRSNIE